MHVQVVTYRLPDVSDPEFIAGRLSTSFMDRLLSRPAPGRLAEAV